MAEASQMEDFAGAVTSEAMAKDPSVVEFYSLNETCVFWNMDDYTIPLGNEGPQLFEIFEEALEQMGFHGDQLGIEAFGVDKLERSSKELYRQTGISYIPEDIFTMFERILVTALSSSPPGRPPANLFVIAKQQPQESLLNMLLPALEARNYNVLILEPTTPDFDFYSVESIVKCTKLLDGRKPIAGPELECIWETDESMEEE